MRISVLFTTVLLGISAITSCAPTRDRNDVLVFSPSGVITSDDYKKVIAAVEVCEASLVKQGIPLDTLAALFSRQDCTDQILHGTSLHVIVSKPVSSHDRHTTRVGMTETCRDYVEEHHRQVSFLSPYAANIMAFNDLTNCLTAVTLW